MYFWSILISLVGLSAQAESRHSLRSQSSRKLQKTNPRVVLIHKNDKLRVATVFIKVDKAYETNFLDVFGNTQVNTLEKHFVKIFAHVNQVYNRQLQLHFQPTFEVSHDAEKGQYPWLFDVPKADHHHRCEEKAFMTEEDSSARMGQRLRSFETWATAHPNKNAAAVLLFTGCSYTFQVSDTTGPRPSDSEFPMALDPSRVTTGRSFVLGKAFLESFCSKTGNVGLVSQSSAKSGKSSSSIALITIHELGHLLGAKDKTGGANDHFGVMDYNGGMFKGIRQFHDAHAAEIQPTFDLSVSAGADRSSFLSPHVTCFIPSIVGPEGDSCPQHCLSGLGDGVCLTGEASAECRTEKCNFDGGDCNKDGSSTCAPGCYDHWMGDGVCDPLCMVSSCRGEESDCKCNSRSAIDKCLAVGGRSEVDCLATCGKGSESIVDILKSLEAQAHELLAKYSIYVFVIIAVLLFLCLCCCCCSCYRSL